MGELSAPGSVGPAGRSAKFPDPFRQVAESHSRSFGRVAAGCRQLVLTVRRRCSGGKGLAHPPAQRLVAAAVGY